MVVAAARADLTSYHQGGMPVKQPEWDGQRATISKGWGILLVALLGPSDGSSVYAPEFPTISW
jgi:hypothetical protein